MLKTGMTLGLTPEEAQGLPDSLVKELSVAGQREVAAERQKSGMPVEVGSEWLSKAEEDWLVKLATSVGKRLSAATDRPPKRTMRSLAAKGFATEVAGECWELTEAGQRRCTSIY